MIYDIHNNPSSCLKISKVLDIKTNNEIRHVFFVDDKEGKEKAVIKRYATDKDGNVVMNKEKTELKVIKETRWIKMIKK